MQVLSMVSVFCFFLRHFPVIVPLGACPEFIVEQGNDSDIDRYISEQFRWDTDDNTDEKKGQLLSMLRNLIDVKSRGSFLWAVSIVPIVSDEHRKGEPNHGLIQLVEELPADITNLYEKIFLSLEHKDASLKFFRWLCFSNRPLSIAELREAMNLNTHRDVLSFSQSEKSPTFIEFDGQMEKRIRTLSGRLAELTTWVKEVGTPEWAKEVDEHTKAILTDLVERKERPAEDDMDCDLDVNRVYDSEDERISYGQQKETLVVRLNHQTVKTSSSTRDST